MRIWAGLLFAAAIVGAPIQGADAASTAGASAAVPLPIPRPAKQLDPKRLIVIDLKCPSGESGRVELISKNADGVYEKIDGDFIGEDATVVVVYTKNEGSEYRLLATINLKETTDKDEIIFGAYLSNRVKSLGYTMCLSEYRSLTKYLELLQLNRRAVNGQ